jgi:phosphohistidine phosphatase
VETTEVVAASLGVGKIDVKQTPHLAPGASTEQLFAEIKSYTGVETVALIGHQPDLGNLISRIISGAGAVASIQLKKGSICCVNVTETVPTLRGQMMWLSTPRQLRLLAKA